MRLERSPAMPASRPSRSCSATDTPLPGLGGHEALRQPKDVERVVGGRTLQRQPARGGLAASPGTRAQQGRGVLSSRASEPALRQPPLLQASRPSQRAQMGSSLRATPTCPLPSSLRLGEDPLASLPPASGSIVLPSHLPSRRHARLATKLHPPRKVEREVRRRSPRQQLARGGDASLA